MTILSFALWVYPVNQDPYLAVNSTPYDIVTVAEPNENLTILVDGNDIRKQNLNLKVYSVTLRNLGDRDISPSMYDVDAPLTIALTNCDLLSCNVITSPNSSKSIFTINSDSSTIVLDDLLLKQGDKVEMKLTVLHKSTSQPALQVSGRIADTQIVVNETDPTTISDFLKIIFVLAVLIGGLWLLGFIFGFLSSLITGIRRAYRSFLFRRLYHIKYKALEQQKILIQLYGRFGKKKFIEIMENLISRDHGSQVYKDELQNTFAVSRVNKLRDEGKIDTGLKTKMEYEAPIVLAVAVLKKYELLTYNDDDSIQVEDNVLQEIKSMLEVLRQ